jgi:peptidoglycan/xylan/chitin deacetylase (PgdA/CDA1 family)
VDRRTALASLAAVLGTAACAGGVTRTAGATTERPAGHPAPTATPSTSAPPPRTTAPDGPAPRPAIAGAGGPDIVHGRRDRREVALTFHGAGDAGLARRVLQACASHQARVTVFAVGQWLVAEPHMASAVLDGGHELGNHTWSHQQMTQLTASRARDEAVRGAQALRAATGTAGWWFRPSGTLRSTAMIRAAAAHAGYRRCVSYDVDPEDFRDPGAARVRSRTLAAVRPGSIVSLHLGHEGTLVALPGILEGLAARGLEAVTLSRLLRDGA